MESQYNINVSGFSKGLYILSIGYEKVKIVME